MIIYNPEIVSKWIVILVFLVGGILNTIGIQSVRDEFSRWGLNSWIRIGVGLCELVIAILLIMNVWVSQNLIFAALIMIFAVLIIAYNREYTKTCLPAVVLLVIMISLSLQ
ncbi:DoxX family protein [Pectobacterium polaris]|uniref:DoxX family protein n=1 Tax=Pectobacterium polaris TaxID=2042057 RepID=UPI0023B133BA|nr:DoxX family protein [Pectobacterium polaris]MDE8743812.1 DoxX family protein [Pectobacterium polaris]